MVLVAAGSSIQYQHYVYPAEPVSVQHGTQSFSTRQVNFSLVNVKQKEPMCGWARQLTLFEAPSMVVDSRVSLKSLI
jgi:hypothetical protein